MWLLGFLFTTSGLLIGGTIVGLFKGFQKNVDIIYGVCAGIMLGLISFEIFPEAIELGGWFITIIGFAIGMVLFQVLHSGVHYSQGKKSTSTKKMYVRTGLLLIVSFSVHNVPIGIILGASEESDFTMALLQTLLFHSIPEGIILFTPLILAGTNVFFGFLISIIVSIPVALGVFIGAFLGWDDPSINALFISSTIGIIFMVTVSEILYPALINYPLFKVLTHTLIGLGIIGIYIQLI